MCDNEYDYADVAPRTRVVALPPFTVAFPSIVKPYSGLNDFLPAKYMFAACYLPSDYPQLSELHNAIQDCAEDRFGLLLTDDGSEALDPKLGRRWRNPLRQGTRTLEKFLVVRASSKYKPLSLVMEEGGMYMARDGDIKAGDICQAMVTPFAYDVNGNIGVGLGIVSFTKISGPSLTPEEAAIFADPEVLKS